MPLNTVGKEEFDNTRVAEEFHNKSVAELKPEIDQLITLLQNPVEIQKELAAKIKIGLDRQIDQDMQQKGYISDFTRQACMDFNKILDNIQKSLHGDKSTIIVHKVSHADVSNLIRQHAKTKTIINITPKKEEQ